MSVSFGRSPLGGQWESITINEHTTDIRFGNGSLWMMTPATGRAAYFSLRKRAIQSGQANEIRYNLVEAQKIKRELDERRRAYIEREAKANENRRIREDERKLKIAATKERFQIIANGLGVGQQVNFSVMDEDGRANLSFNMKMNEEQTRTMLEAAISAGLLTVIK